MDELEIRNLETASKAEKVRAESIEGNGETILLVDDEEILLELGCDILELLGYRVLKASDGKEAIDVYKQNITDIDLVILDVAMPIMGGIEAAFNVQELNPDVKLMFLTAYAWNRKVVEKAETLGASIIGKPYRVQGLSHAISLRLGS
jgi:CheY-like chemotaxis protein